MEDIFSVGFWIIVGALILYWIISAIVDKIQEPYETKANLINLEQEKSKYEKLSKNAEDAIDRANKAEDDAKDKFRNAEIERKNYVELRKDLVLRYNKAKEQLDADVHRKALEMLSYSNDFLLAFAPQCDIAELHQGIMEGRLLKAFEVPPTISDVKISALVKSPNSVYTTTLKDCTCQDFYFRKHPCKHMLYLYYTVCLLYAEKPLMDEALFKIYSEIQDKKAYINQLNNNKTKLENEIENIKYTKRCYERTLEDLKSEIENSKRNIVIELDEFKQLLDDKNFRFTKMAQEFAEFSTQYYDANAYYLLHKNHPALSAADTVKALKREAKIYVRELAELRLKLEYIEKLFPNINDIFEPGFNGKDDFELETAENTDRVRFFISPEEYKELSTTEKNQLALDRYVEQRKSKWQIGRDYEMYVGHRLEEKGYAVKYTGIVENLEDMGRDLIATKDGKTLIVQCKNWSQEKTIHEKHVFQLYGTLVLYKLDNPMFEAKGIFVTTTKLSEKARAVAKELDIKIVEQLPLGDFPRIKCNVNRTTGEKIYHLPFDQQYDTTVINEKDGEFYAFTVKEAETQGFRRAWKHYQ